MTKAKKRAYKEDTSEDEMVITKRPSTKKSKVEPSRPLRSSGITPAMDRLSLKEAKAVIMPPTDFKVDAD